MSHEHSCGHSHDDAGHGHYHEHEHEHSHHEELFEAPWGTAQIETHTHEQAATVSMALHPAEGEAIAFAGVVTVMRQIAEEAESAGGVVGHVKAFARQGDAFAHASVTAAYLGPEIGGDSSSEFGEEADIQLVAIVLLLS